MPALRLTTWSSASVDWKWSGRIDSSDPRHTGEAYTRRGRVWMESSSRTPISRIRRRTGVRSALMALLVLVAAAPGCRPACPPLDDDDDDTTTADDDTATDDDSAASDDDDSAAGPVVWVHVAAGDDHSCGLRSDGQVLCWGDDSAGPSSTPTARQTV